MSSLPVLPTVPEQLTPAGLYNFLLEVKRGYEALTGQGGDSIAEFEYASQADIMAMSRDVSCFMAYNSVATPNISVGSAHTIIFDSVWFDFQDNYDETSGVFTAPVDGIYQFTANVNLGALDSAASKYSLKLITSNVTFSTPLDPSKFSGDLTDFPLRISIPLNMDANDTAYITLTQTGGTAQTDINISSTFAAVFVTSLED